jgi:hypothetical protein
MCWRVFVSVVVSSAGKEEAGWIMKMLAATVSAVEKEVLIAWTATGRGSVRM